MNQYGSPLIRYMFLKAKERFDSAFYGYINSDILISPNIFNLTSVLTFNQKTDRLSDNVFSYTCFSVV